MLLVRASFWSGLQLYIIWIESWEGESSRLSEGMTAAYMILFHDRTPPFGLVLDAPAQRRT
jgi:hypothetical protein